MDGRDYSPFLRRRPGASTPWKAGNPPVAAGVSPRMAGRIDARQSGAVMALGGASLVAGLLLLESGARVLLPSPERVTVRAVPDLDDRLARENGDPKKLAYRGAVNALFIKTPTGRRLRASTEVTIENHYLSHRTIVLRTNSLGFRGPELGDKTRPRVLFLGDSITMAHYLPEEQTFVRLIGGASERDGGPPLETVNAGVGGVGLENELALLRETGLRASPDVVVLEFYLNDVQPSPGVGLVRLPDAFDWSVAARHAANALPRLFARDDREVGDAEMEGWLAEIRRRAPAAGGDPGRDPGAFNALVQENYRDWGSAWSDSVWERLDPVLAEFKRQADEHRFRLRVVAFPVEPQVTAAFVSDWPQRRLASAARRLGIPVLDLLPVLRDARARDDAPLFYDVCHHTPAGSAVVADAILEFLRRTS